MVVAERLRPLSFAAIFFFVKSFILISPFYINSELVSSEKFMRKFFETHAKPLPLRVGWKNE